MKTIALSGYAKSGKDTVADILVKEHGFKKFAFADKLKEAVVALDPFITIKHPMTPPELDDFISVSLSKLLETNTFHELKLQYPEVHRLLQRMGTEVGRNLFGEDFWVDLLMNSDAYDLCDLAVISDCRFQNEADAVANSHNGYVWRINRPGIVPVNDHISEVGLDDYPFDVILDNAGNIEDLKSAVKNLVDNL